MATENLRHATSVILRLVGALMVFVAAVFATLTASEVIAALLTTDRLPPGVSISFPHFASSFALFSFVKYGLIMGWGLLLYRFAPALAHGVCQDLKKSRESADGG